MDKKVMEVINDFNRLCDYETVHQKDNLIYIKDLQLDNQITEHEVIDWMEKIYTYYIEEIPDYINFKFSLVKKEEIKDYYNKILNIIECIEELNGFHA
jgi:hypothetical protein